MLQFRIPNWNHSSSSRGNRCPELWYQMLQPRWRERGLRPHLCQSLVWHHWLSWLENVQCCGMIWTILSSWKDLVGGKKKRSKVHFKKGGTEFNMKAVNHGIYREAARSSEDVLPVCRTPQELQCSGLSLWAEQQAGGGGSWRQCVCWKITTRMVGSRPAACTV